MYQEMRNNPPPVNNSLISANTLPNSKPHLPYIHPHVLPTGLNRYTIGDEGLKLQPPPKYDGSVEGHACEEWIEDMRAYMSYYEKRSVFADGKNNIGFAQGYLKYVKESLDRPPKIRRSISDWTCATCRNVGKVFCRYAARMR